MDGVWDRTRGALAWLLVSSLINGTESLQNLKIVVPEKVRVGDSALLTCSYDLQVQLYTIKWYFEEEEFYRYVPKKDPPHSTFPVRDIHVNVTSSNTQDVTLVNVQKNHTGRYKCEVSEEAPLYDTKLQEAYILVVDVPDTEPKVVVNKKHLPTGEILRANCTSGASRLAPNITWTLNGKLILQPSNWINKLRMYSDLINNIHEEKNITRSMVSFNTSGLFQNGHIRLRCFAEISPVYKASTSIEITEDAPNLASITSDASPQSHQSNYGNCLHTSSSSVLILSFFLITELTIESTTM